MFLKVGNFQRASGRNISPWYFLAIQISNLQKINCEYNTKFKSFSFKKSLYFTQLYDCQKPEIRKKRDFGKLGIGPIVIRQNENSGKWASGIEENRN